MAETPVQTNSQSYQAPLEVGGYVNPSVSKIPSQPIDLYGLMGVSLIKKGKPRAKNPYELMMEGNDLFANLIPDAAPLQTSLTTIKPLDDPAGLFHSQDGFGKYGYSSLLHGGDNEDRYAQNFKRDNPDLFWRPGFHPWEGIKKGFYWGGGFLEKTLESAAIKTGQGLAGLYGMTIGNTLGAISGEQKFDGFNDWLSQSSDNVFSNFFQGWDDNLKSRFHYFQEAADRNKKGFIASLGDGDFWMNDISDGLGFLVSAALEVGLISKLGLGTKLATRFAPLAEGVSTEALNAGKIGRTGLQKTMNLLGVEGSGHSFVKNAVDLTSQTLAVTAIESAVEANEVKQKVYDSFQGKVNPETGMYYTEEEKKRLSAAAAAETFKQNLAILIGPKFLEVLVFNRIGKFAKGMFNKSFAHVETEAGRASGAVRSKIGNLSSGTTYAKTSALKDVFKIGSIATLGFLSEGLFEENVQLATSRTAEATFGAGDEFFRPSTTPEDISKAQKEDELFGNVSRRYLSQTRQFFKGVGDNRAVDDELSKSIGIGGIFGVGGGVLHVSLGLRQQAKVDNYWNNRLNQATTNLFESQHFFQTKTDNLPDPANPGKTKPVTTIITNPKTGQPILDENKLKGFLNKMNNIQGIMDIVANTEDTLDENNKLSQNKELNKLARNVMFTQLAMEYVRAGKKDQLLSNLTSSSQFSDKDIQALGYEPGFMKEDEKKNMVARMAKIVQRLAIADNWIENNVIDNISEPREGFKGLKYSKTQKEKRQQEFEAKKAYLRGLAQQNVLLDSYLDEISESEINLEVPAQELLSSVLDENGVPVIDFSVPLATVSRNFNSRIPALKNQIDVLQKEFGYHWDNMLSHERNSPKTQEFSHQSKTNTGKSLFYEQMKAQEALEKMNDLQAEHDRLVSERQAFLNNDKAFELREEDGNFYILPKGQQPESLTLEQLNADKTRRINGVKREEIGIQKKWIDDEWKLTAALKEEKIKAGREETYYSRRMSLNLNAYNTYFQREVMDKDNSLGQRKLKLYNKDASKRIDAKKYKNNEEKLLKAVRIQGKVATILADVNGQKLLAEIEALLDENLQSEQFTTKLKRITDNYNGKPLIMSASDKNLVNEQLDQTQDEYSFVASIFEFMPEDDRFNEKYYDINDEGNFVVKPEFDNLQELARVQKELQDRIDDLNKIKAFLNSIPESIPGDWNNINTVKKRIADVYTETTDSVINNYNQLSNNGQSEVSGDSLSTKQDLDLVEGEIDELGQLKEIFNNRDSTDKILQTLEFQGFIAAIDKRIEDLKKIREIIKERLSSRLRENQDFLIDAIHNFVEQLGLNFDGLVQNQELHDAVERVATPEIFSKLKTSLVDLKVILDKTDQTAEDKKAILDAYWNLNGQVAAIQEVIKASKTKEDVLAQVYNQKSQAIRKLEGTALMQRLKDHHYYKDIIQNIDDSLLGTLQLIFYQSEFSQVGIAGGGSDISFLDDQPSSPVYKFREDYNLRKFLRGIEKDNSRTPQNTDVSKDELLEFLTIAKNIQNLEDIQKSLNSEVNLLDQIEKEKEVVQAKIDKKDNKYENLIVSSIQQIFFIRNIASFLKRNTGGRGFRNWIYIQAPGGAGKTQTLGTWFDAISGIPRDRVLATAFTEEAARGIKKALFVGEEGPKDANEMIDYVHELIKNKDYEHDVLIIDEFPAIDVQTQKALFKAVSEYTAEKLAADKGEFKVITLGDTNQLTFSENGSVTPRPSIIINPNLFNDTKTGVNENHPAKMNIIPSLTINFRSNLFAVTSFIDQFKGSNNDNVNATLKVASDDPTLEKRNSKGVIALSKGEFGTKIISYLKANPDSTRTRALVVNETKIDQYKKLLTDNGIKIVTDPNDEVTKGIYVTTVKNVQGFSFDEVFIDLENNDKTLFSGTSSLNYIYNKAMYVAASRARNLIIVTNFPNIENVEDDSISTLENKALEELQTKDTEFVAQRDLEINGAKSIMGNEYARSVKTATPVKATEKSESTLDPDKDEEDIDDEETADEQEEKEKEEATKVEEEVVEEQPEPEGTADESVSAEIIATPGIDDDTEVKEEKQTADQVEKDMLKKLADSVVTAYTKVRDEVVELLFPTAQTIKYKVLDGDFTVKIPDTYENRDLRDNDRITLIPFQQSKTANSPRKFGYAIVTPAIDSDEKVVPNSYRTVSVLSDHEIDKLKEKSETKRIYNTIEDNEKRDKGFVSILYSDVNDENGFTTDQGKVINELENGSVVHANAVKYFFKDTYKPMNKAAIDDMIKTFIENFYKNHLDSFPQAQRQSEHTKIKKFYENPENAQIIIPTKKDIEGKKPNLRVPPELRTYVRAGRPYLVFKPFHKRSTQQFIALSRKFLNTKEHNDAIEPIRNFINLAKSVRQTLEKKGVTNKLGYSKSLSNMLSKIAYNYLRNPNPQEGEFKIKLFSTEDSKKVSKDLTFSIAEAERIYELYSMYSQPNTQVIEAKTEKEVQNLTKIKKARNYTFEDGETIYGIIESYDPTTKTFVVKDNRSEETLTKSGIISHTGKSYVGVAQEALDNLMNSNGNIASKFTSIKGRTGFVTDKDKSGNDVYKGFKFMALLGSKTAPVPKSFDKDNNVKESYTDVIDILEDLFNFGVKGEIPSKNLKYIDSEGNAKDIEVKFRVPIPINARNERGELEHDYTNSSQNTSRDSAVSNSKFFETNFDTLLPSRVFIQFGEQEDVEEVGQPDQVSVQDQQKETKKSQVFDVKNMTEYDISTLSFNEIRERLTEAQIKIVDTYAKKEGGFKGIDEFFAYYSSNHPEEQEAFRTYLIDCLL